MPYIKKHERDVYNQHLYEIIYNWKNLFHYNPGHLNYIISKLLKEALDHRGTSYAVVNELLGVLEAAKLELYRKVGAPYEEKKEKDNGKVY